MSVLSPVIGFVIHKFIHFNQKRHVSTESWNLLARIIGTEVEIAINTQANMSGTARNINEAKNCYKIYSYFSVNKKQLFKLPLLPYVLPKTVANNVPNKVPIP